MKSVEVQFSGEALQQTATLFDVPRGTEELLRRVERTGVDTTGQADDDGGEAQSHHAVLRRLLEW